jgi:hypothetical protein
MIMSVSKEGCGDQRFFLKHKKSSLPNIGDGKLLLAMVVFFNFVLSKSSKFFTPLPKHFFLKKH